MEIELLRQGYFLILIYIFSHIHARIRFILSYLKNGDSFEGKYNARLSMIVNATGSVLYYLIVPIAFFYTVDIIKIDYSLHRGVAKANSLHYAEFFILAFFLILVSATSILEAKEKVAMGAKNNIVIQLIIILFYKSMVGYMLYWFITLYSPWAARTSYSNESWINISPEVISHWFVWSNITIFYGAYFYYRNIGYCKKKDSTRAGFKT